METGAIVGVTVHGADQGDTTTIAETVTAAAEELEAVAAATDGTTAVIDEVVTRQGYYSNQVLVDLAALDLRAPTSRNRTRPAHWTKKAAARAAVYANRRRIRGPRGLALLRRRSERLERPNAHLYETGGMRRTHLRGHTNILKRLLVHVGGFNLGLFMRTRFGIGTPRSLQGRVAVIVALIAALWTRITDGGAPSTRPPPITRTRSRRGIVSSCSRSVHQNELFNHGLLGTDVSVVLMSITFPRGSPPGRDAFSR